VLILKILRKKRNFKFRKPENWMEINSLKGKQKLFDFCKYIYFLTS